VHSGDSSASQKKLVLFINLLGNGLTQDIHGDGGFTRWATTEFISDGIRAGFEFTYPSGNFNIHWNCFTQIGNVGTIIGSLK